VQTRLMNARDPEGFWEGRLSSSALSTATAITALAILDRFRGNRTYQAMVANGLHWLRENMNSDGGWGDTDRSASNLSTTTLVWDALGACEAGAEYATVIQSAENWLKRELKQPLDSDLDPEQLARAIVRCYGKDRTFSVPILTMTALSGRLGNDTSAWKHVIPLPFELSVIPHQAYKWVRMPVVSYALPALIAIGQVRHQLAPSKNPIARCCRKLAFRKATKILTAIQPASGGFLEATPLTAFVLMSLAASGREHHQVSQRCESFLVESMREDGSWPIDTHLATWVTSLSIQALPEGSLSPDEQQKTIQWLLGQQWVETHPYTHADPGGWAWTPLTGGVPDADDTPGAILALQKLKSSKWGQTPSESLKWGQTPSVSRKGTDTFCTEEKGQTPSEERTCQTLLKDEKGQTPFGLEKDHKYERCQTHFQAEQGKGRTPFSTYTGEKGLTPPENDERCQTHSADHDGRCQTHSAGHDGRCDGRCQTLSVGDGRCQTPFPAEQGKGQTPFPTPFSTEGPQAPIVGIHDIAIETAIAAGLNWLLGLQNRDGGFPTFCRGWGTLPFDKSCCDLTAHVLRAFCASTDLHAANLLRSMQRALSFLEKQQRDDGSWVPLWFGNESAPNRENPVFGSSRVLIALLPIQKELSASLHYPPKMLTNGIDYLLSAQLDSGAWAGWRDAPSDLASIEETALALEALCLAQKSGISVEALRLQNGFEWLINQVDTGHVSATPIGLYFASLWYYEDLYPIIFSLRALVLATEEPACDCPTQ